MLIGDHGDDRRLLAIRRRHRSGRIAWFGLGWQPARIRYNGGVASGEVG